jgi:hypothetical protein
MKVELKTTNLTKSKINQMDYIAVTRRRNVEVIGWVNIGKKRYVIVKVNGCFYRAEFITLIEKEVKGVQFPAPSGGYEFPYLTNIKCKTFNRSCVTYSAEREEEKNLELYDDLVSFKRKSEIAGQIYY